MLLDAGEFTLADGLVGDNWLSRGSRHTEDGQALPDRDRLRVSPGEHVDRTGLGNLRASSERTRSPADPDRAASSWPSLASLVLRPWDVSGSAGVSSIAVASFSRPARVVGVAVDTTERKTGELERERLLREAREEEWKQTTARLLSPEGLLVGISFTPWMHSHEHDPDDRAGDEQPPASGD